MSLRRGGAKRGEYIAGYLRSGAWRARRRRYFVDRRAAEGAVTCPGCDDPLADRTADVHHLSYDGVVKREDGVWVSGEKDEDLLAMCRWCHERVHKLLDRDRGWSSRDRRDATWAVIRVIHQQLQVRAAAMAAEGRRGR